MRRTLFLLLALAPAASAAEPKAAVTAPATVAPGARLWLDFTGCASDSPLYVQCDGPAPLKLTLLYPAAGGPVPAFGYADPATGGKYRFITVATGTAAGDKAPGIVAASCDVTVSAAPTPPPPPGPPPTPTPPPAPGPVTGKLYAVLLYTPDPANAAYTAAARMIADPALRTALAALDVEWHAWPAASEMVAASKLLPYVPASGDPAMVVYDPAGTVYDANGAALPATLRAGFAPPAASQDVVNLFKRIRGK